MKTLELLARAYSYDTSGKTIITIKPELDTRSETIKTRIGLERDVDLVVNGDTVFVDILNAITRKGEDISHIFVDETNFLTSKHVGFIVSVSDIYDIDVTFYGLKTDFRGEMFEGSMKAMTMADEIVQITAPCSNFDCDNSATYNMRLVNGEPTTEGEQVEIGDVNDNEEISYYPVCRMCYMESRVEREEG